MVRALWEKGLFRVFLLKKYKN